MDQPIRNATQTEVGERWDLREMLDGPAHPKCNANGLVAGGWCLREIADGAVLPECNANGWG